VAQLFEAAQGSSLLLAIVGVVYIGLVVVLAITAVFAPRPSRRKAALEVLRVVWVRRERSHVTTTAAVATVIPHAAMRVIRHGPASSGHA
jgi:hypothetical protein